MSKELHFKLSRYFAGTPKLLYADCPVQPCAFCLSVFRLFVHKPVRLTMPVCVLSCAYCGHHASVPPLTSTCCKVETMTPNTVPCICTGLTLRPFLLPLTPCLVLPPLTFDPCSKDWLACHVRTR